ncbi:hypothetical protein [Allokutzneria sp. NRRL B-24872]|uniref:hypothetical protein n=1 Tax=Allokutzneria sp. NRRL B-24872 TaxID=1137961 RepID=UPI000A38D4B9|nr:hypothetical protein [Allokutzneria sp. NRRL B-24872]
MESDQDGAPAAAEMLLKAPGLVVTVGDLIGSVVRSAELGEYEIYDRTRRPDRGSTGARDDAAEKARIDGVIFAAHDQAGVLTEGRAGAFGGCGTVPQITKNRPAR